MLRPFALAGEKGRIHFAHGGDGALETVGKRLPGQFVDERLGIIEVKMARTAFHEEKYDVLGSPEDMGNLRHGGIGCGCGKQALACQGG